MPDLYPEKRLHSLDNHISPRGFGLDESEYVNIEEISDYALNKFLFEGLAQVFTFRFDPISWFLVKDFGVSARFFAVLVCFGMFLYVFVTRKPLYRMSPI